MDLHLVVELVSLGVILLAGGRWIGKIESAAAKLDGATKNLEQIPVLATKVGMLENSFSKHLSDHRGLEGRVDDTRDIAVRADLKSSPALR